MTVRLRQSVFVPPPLYVVADQRGFLAEAGVEVETTLTRSSDQQRAQLVAGDCDLAVTAIDNLIVWNATGASIRLLAQVERTTPLHLLGRKGFDTITALRGAELGVDAVDNGFAIVLRHLLRSHGLTSDDYTLTPVGGVRERYAALLAGAIAATLLGPPWTSWPAGRACRYCSPSATNCPTTQGKAWWPDRPGWHPPRRSAPIWPAWTGLGTGSPQPSPRMRSTC